MEVVPSTFMPGHGPSRRNHQDQEDQRRKTYCRVAMLEYWEIPVGMFAHAQRYRRVFHLVRKISDLFQVFHWQNCEIAT